MCVCVCVPHHSPHFDDKERLRVLVMMAAQELSNGISLSGHMYAMTRAGRTLSPSGDLQETFGGMDQVSRTPEEPKNSANSIEVAASELSGF